MPPVSVPCEHLLGTYEYESQKPTAQKSRRAAAQESGSVVRSKCPESVTAVAIAAEFAVGPTQAGRRNHRASPRAIAVSVRPCATRRPSVDCAPQHAARRRRTSERVVVQAIHPQLGEAPRQREHRLRRQAPQLGSASANRGKPRKRAPSGMLEHMADLEGHTDRVRHQRLTVRASIAVPVCPRVRAEPSALSLRRTRVG